MEYFEAINRLMDDYIAEVRNILSNLRLCDGIFGMGNDPKKNPCHMNFYYELEKLVASSVSSEPTEEDAFASAELLIKAPDEKACAPVARCTLVATRKMAIQFIPYLTAEHKDELKRWFDDNVPRRTRMPIEKDVYDALEN